ncbi:hypothetical protein DM02DRAFT_65411 [Periconia macrospinosa]|uniref:Secreted protein n=1 Tax=Periconia macrospinosa TaxID=97972 RepID=A0A2V1DL15_9PLEO|nr:hypothetical protein DM02DRAFT_65411 [Periconia macrospinosa]
MQAVLAGALFALAVFAKHTQSLHAYPPIIYLRTRFRRPVVTIHDPANPSIQSEVPTKDACTRVDGCPVQQSHVRWLAPPLIFISRSRGGFFACRRIVFSVVIYEKWVIPRLWDLAFYLSIEARALTRFPQAWSLWDDLTSPGQLVFWFLYFFPCCM